MTVRTYRWDDASAPVLTGNAGDYKLIDVLDKCLVAGYGSKSAAGWTKEFTGTGKAVFKQGTGSNAMRLRVDCSSSSQTPRLRGYEVMTDVDTGTGPFPTDAQLSGGCYAFCSNTANTTERPWMVVATEKCFYLYIGFNNTTVQGISGSSSYQPTYFFGDITSLKSGDAYHTLLIADTSGSEYANMFAAAASINTACNGCFMSRSHTQIGGSITIGKAHDYHRGNTATFGGGAGGTAYPDPVTGGMLLEVIRIFEPSAIVTRGTMPGCYVPLHLLPGNPGDTFTGNGTLAGKSFILWDTNNAGTRGRIALETSDTW